MARYFMHLRDETDLALDEEGVEFPSLDAVRAAALAGARDCIASDIRASGLIDFRLRIDAENEAGDVVYRLPFMDAVEVVTRGAQSRLDDE